MERSHVVSQLLRKKSELLGRVSAIKDELHRIETDIKPLDQAVKLFSPTTDVDGVAARRKRSHLFRRGELVKHILTALRQKGKPMTAIEIMKTVKVRTKLKQDILPNVKRCLREQAKAGTLIEVGEAFGRQKLWTIAARKNQATAAASKGVVELRPRP